MQEFIGYCLIPSNKGQRMMVIKGSGGEGKSPVGRPGPVTPWGKPTLGYKTRKKNHRTDKQIARRRNGK